MESAPTTDNRAAYAIRVSGRLGPLLLSSLRRAGVVRLDTSSPVSTVTFAASGTDVVELAERLAGYGMEIESLREIDQLSPGG